MQNILEIDPFYFWIRSLSGCRQGSKTVSTEVKYINEKKIQSLLIPRCGKNVVMPLKELREAY